MKKSQLGEIATILALSTLIIIGLSSLASSFFLKNRNTVKSKAVGPTCGCNQIVGSSNYHWVDGEGCDPIPEFTDSTCNNLVSSTITISPSSGTAGSDLVTACKCAGDKAAGDCPVNPCGPIPQKESAPNTDPSCSGNWGAWSNVCSGNTAGCASDAGETYTYWCDGDKWRFQYANCVSWCRVDYLQNPPSNKDSLCRNASAGDLITDTFNGTLPGGVEKGDAQGVDVPEKFKYVSCDGNVGVWVEVNPFCDQFGQIGWAPARTSKKTCTPPNITVSRTPSGKFWLKADVEIKKASKGIEFDTTVTFNSTDCDGDTTLYKNGVLQAGPKPWQRPKGFSGGVFDLGYSPQWTGPDILEPGNKANISYRGRVDNCPRSNVPLEDTISCEFGVSPYGIPWVRGAGCSLKNFSDVQKITPATTLVVKKQPTWAPPPPPRLKTTPIIFKPESTQTTTPGQVTRPVNTPGKEGSVCAYGYPCDSSLGLVCSDLKGEGTFKQGVCKKAGTSTTSSPATSGEPSSSSFPTNSCPDGNGANCAWFCGTNSFDTGRVCASPLDKCCAFDTPENRRKFPPIIPTSELKEVEYDFPVGAIEQFFRMGELRLLYVCDFYGKKGFLGSNDVRNCHEPESITPAGNKVKIKYKVKTNQQQMTCVMNISWTNPPVPKICTPLNFTP